MPQGCTFLCLPNKTLSCNTGVPFQIFAVVRQNQGNYILPGYNLNQIPYDYIVEVTNKFQGIRSDKECAWRTMDRDLWHCTRGNNQNHPKEQEMQEGKMVVWGGLTNSWEKKWKVMEERKDISNWMQSFKEEQRVKKAFLKWTMQRKRGKK